MSGSQTSISLTRVLDGDGAVVGALPEFARDPAALLGLDLRGATQRAAFDYIDERIRANAREVLAASRRDDMLPRAAALALAERRVKQAMQLGRWQ
jgi:glutamate dehydrogenase (NAD(P)+)